MAAYEAGSTRDKYYAFNHFGASRILADTVVF
jgi:hypothetical protein